jgi:hypothetical protein
MAVRGDPVRVRWVVLLALLTGVLVIAIAAPGPGAEDAAVPARTPGGAIRTWLADHRAEMFPTYEGAYVGTCRESLRDGLCSIARDDLGPRLIYGVGVYGTNWGAELLLESADAGDWSVIASWPWGAPGADDAEAVFGPPWSPHTAIAEWWRAHGTARYPGRPPVAYVQDCATSGADPSVTQQTLVCSTLVAASDERRVYRTGPLPAGEGTVLVLEHRSDHTWAVSERGG